MKFSDVNMGILQLLGFRSKKNLLVINIISIWNLNSSWKEFLINSLPFYSLLVLHSKMGWRLVVLQNYFISMVCAITSYVLSLCETVATIAQLWDSNGFMHVPSCNFLLPILVIH